MDLVDLVLINLTALIEVIELTVTGFRWRAELFALIIRGGFALTLGAYAVYLKSQKQHVTARE